MEALQCSAVGAEELQSVVARQFAGDGVDARGRCAVRQSDDVLRRHRAAVANEARRGDPGAEHCRKQHQEGEAEGERPACSRRKAFEEQHQQPPAGAEKIKVAGTDSA